MHFLIILFKIFQRMKNKVISFFHLLEMRIHYLAIQRRKPIFDSYLQSNAIWKYSFWTCLTRVKSVSKFDVILAIFSNSFKNMFGLAKLKILAVIVYTMSSSDTAKH